MAEMSPSESLQFPSSWQQWEFHFSGYNTIKSFEKCVENVMAANEIDSLNQHANVNSKYAWLLAKWRTRLLISTLLSARTNPLEYQICAKYTVYYILHFVVCAMWHYLISAQRACQHLNDALATSHKPTPCTLLYRVIKSPKIRKFGTKRKVFGMPHSRTEKANKHSRILLSLRLFCMPNNYPNLSKRKAHDFRAMKTTQLHKFGVGFMMPWRNKFHNVLAQLGLELNIVIIYQFK